MNPARALSGLWRAPTARRRLALEALAELLRARLLTLAPARVYTREFGALGAIAALPASDQDAAEAERVGRMVEAVAGHLPLRLLCLQQAIACRRMLARRGVPSSVCLGVSRDGADRARPREGRAAHAWVEVGSRVISGAGELERYVLVARFG